MNKLTLLSSLLIGLLACLPISALGQDEITPDSTEFYSNNPDIYIRDTGDGFYIELMDVDITIHADRTYDVIEQIDANFVESRHGLIRDIPTRFWVNRDVSEKQDSSEYKLLYNGVKIKNIEVSEEYTENNDGELKSLRIGSADRTIWGPHHYQIKYRLELPNDRVKYGDLVFHSILGAAWSCSMDSVHFVIHLDKEVPDASFDKLKLYVGSEGSYDDYAHNTIDRADNHTIEGSLVEVPAYWGLTLDLPLPEGYFPTDDISIYYYLAWITAIITLLLLIGVIFKELERVETVASVVTFKPRRDLTSADVGSLVDGQVDNIDLLSMIPWFAAKGYLAIEKEGDKTLLRKLKPLPGNAPEYQRELFTGFFAKEGTFDISQSSSAFGAAWERALHALGKQYQGKLDVMEGKGVLIVATICLSLTICFSTVESDGWIVGGVVNVLLWVLMAFIRTMRSNWKNKINFHSFTSAFESIYKLLITAGIGALGLGMLLSAPSASDDNYLPLQVPYGLLAIMVLVILFERRLLRMTDYRRERLAEIKGLEEFVRTAEQDRLRMLLNQNERYFYDILPYAMAFGLVDEWAAKFKDLPVKELTEFGGTSVGQMSHFVDSNRWSAGVSRSVSSYRAASGSSRSSAGGSRGGYSGGGSGGGGGSSW